MKKTVAIALIAAFAAAPASAWTLFGFFDPCAKDLGFAEIWICGPRGK